MQLSKTYDNSPTITWHDSIAPSTRSSRVPDGAELSISRSRVAVRTQQVTQSATRRKSVKSSRELKNFSAGFFAQKRSPVMRRESGNRASELFAAILFRRVRALISHEELPFKIAPGTGVTRAAYITRVRRTRCSRLDKRSMPRRDKATRESSVCAYIIAGRR